jgi:hypothetical protein
MSRFKTYGIIMAWGVALILFEKCCFTIAGTLLERSIGTFHFFMAERLLP